MSHRYLPRPRQRLLRAAQVSTATVIAAPRTAKNAAAASQATTRHRIRRARVVGRHAKQHLARTPYINAAARRTSCRRRSNLLRNLRKHRRSPRPKRNTCTAAEVDSRRSSHSFSSWLSLSVSWRSAPGVSGSNGRTNARWRCPSVSRRTSRPSSKGSACRHPWGASRRRSSTARAAPLCN